MLQVFLFFSCILILVRDDDNIATTPVSIQEHVAAFVEKG
jgi:hypothetical protein